MWAISSYDANSEYSKNNNRDLLKDYGDATPNDNTLESENITSARQGHLGDVLGHGHVSKNSGNHQNVAKCSYGSRNHSSQGMRHIRTDFTQSLVIPKGSSNVSQFSRNINNPTLLEKQKNKLDQAKSKENSSSKRDVFKCNSIEVMEDANKYTTSIYNHKKSRKLPYLMRIGFFGSVGNSKSKPGSSKNTGKSPDKKKLDCSLLDPPRLTANENLRIDGELEATMVGNTSRTNKTFNDINAKNKKDYNYNNYKDSSALSGAVTLINKRTKNSSACSGGHNNNKESACNCSLYHSHQFDGVPSNSFLEEAKERRSLALSTASCQASTNEGGAGGRGGGILDDPFHVFWVPSLSFHPYVHGDTNVNFGSLWPRSKELRKLLQVKIKVKHNGFSLY